MTQASPSGSASEPFDHTVVSAGTDGPNAPLVAAVERRHVGRYIVIERAGLGGMGVVYRAYDPKLDREVALKLLRFESVDSGKGSSGRARLIREARAMAQLAHPNVLPVFDVDTVDDELFIAMEYCKGTTLRAWLRAADRAAGEVLEQFRAAGRGLAAAHAAGLVHRDFKPSNVLVGEDGRVCVMDFGLAKAVGEAEAGSSSMGVSTTDDSHVPSSLSGPLTELGSVLGTPAYMAPEQHRGQEADARSDQFSFCVALFEAIYGTRPFGGEDLRALARDKLGGHITDRPAHPVSARVERAILRGLAPDADARWPTMDALLVELERSVDAVRTRRLALAGLVALGGGGLAIFGFAEGANPLCTGARDKLTGIWDQPARQTIHNALLATEVRYAGDTWERVEALLDVYTDAWAAEHRRACEASNVDRSQSQAMLDRRMGCLDSRLRELQAFATVLASADDTTVERAVHAATDLPAVESCGDEAYLAAEVEPPRDQATAAKVRAERARLAQAKALSDAGRFADAAEIAAQVVTAAGAIGYVPLQAEAHAGLGDFEDEAGHYDVAEAAFEAAFFAAMESGHHSEALDAASNLVFVVGKRHMRPAEALAWAQHAQVELLRVERVPRAEARLFGAIGSVYTTQGRYQDAIAHHGRALEILEGALGPNHLDVTVPLTALGVALALDGRPDEAHARYQRAFEITQQALGPEHPNVALGLMNLGDALYGAGRYEEALAYFNRALATFRDVLGEDHPNVASALNNIGTVLSDTGDHEGAIDCFRRSGLTWERAVGSDHPEVGGAMNNIGASLRRLGRDDEAAAHYQRALVIWERTLGPEHPAIAGAYNNLGVTHDVRDNPELALSYHARAMELSERLLGADHPRIATSLNNIGATLDDIGKFRESIRYHRRALHIREAAYGPSHPLVAESLKGLATAEVGLGRHLSARSHLGRVLEILREHPADPRDVSHALFLLAQATWPTGNHARAVDLASQAQAALVASDPDTPGRWRQVDEWLRKHRAG